MAKKDRNRPTGFDIEGVDGVFIRGGKVSGDIDFARIKDCSDLHVTDYQVDVPGGDEPNRWYKTWWGVLALTVVGGLIVAGLAKVFGWV